MKAKDIMIFLCGLMVVAGTACKNENVPDAPKQETVKALQLTIKEQSDDVLGTKDSPRRMPNATIDDMGSTLDVKWTAGDVVSCCNLSSLNGTTEGIITGTMTAATTGRRSDLTGTVECKVGDDIAIVYPTADLSTYSSTMGGDSPVQCRYHLTLSGQDGTLATLASTYHFVYGRAHVTSVSGEKAEATMDKMQSLMTVCKFSFVDKDAPGTVLPITTLQISYGGSGSTAGKYPQSATVEVTNLTTNSAAQASGVAGSTLPLTINAGGATEVYVALLPEIGSCEYQFTVTSGGNTYTGTASAWLKKGEYVVATNLKLVAN